MQSIKSLNCIKLCLSPTIEKLDADDLIKHLTYVINLLP